MLYFFHGSDRERARQSLGNVLEKSSKDKEVLRITDAHSVADLSAALSGPGLFSLSSGGGRAVVLDSIVGGSNDELREKLLSSLESLKKSSEDFYVLEGSLDALTRKRIEKYAETFEKFDAPKKEKDNSIFDLANALQRGDKKALWVGLMREYAKDSAPEAVHGLLFWGAKQMVLKAQAKERPRAERLVAALAELPHETRRRGEDLGYALERFALGSGVSRT